MHPTVEPPPPYTATSSWQANAAMVTANEELRRRQEELERKAAELQRREDEIQRNMQYQGMLGLIVKKARELNSYTSKFIFQDLSIIHLY